MKTFSDFYAKEAVDSDPSRTAASPFERFFRCFTREVRTELDGFLSHHGYTVEAVLVTDVEPDVKVARRHPGVCT